MRTASTGTRKENSAASKKFGTDKAASTNKEKNLKKTGTQSQVNKAKKAGISTSGAKRSIKKVGITYSEFKSH